MDRTSERTISQSSAPGLFTMKNLEMHLRIMKSPANPVNIAAVTTTSIPRPMLTVIDYRGVEGTFNEERKISSFAVREGEALQ